MRRAREDVARLRLDQATERMARFLIVSTATISRLESLAEIPTDPRQLRTAFVACLVYGVDPAEMGLSPKGLPVLNSLPSTVRDALAKEFPAVVTSRLSLPGLVLPVAA
ncbi:MAG TPA: hypothetical protein VLL25_05945 [Acidimicrobiales bacterium]|nr:hypothetical protein [Acidimicrobiales bacterium]